MNRLACALAFVVPAFALAQAPLVEGYTDQLSYKPGEQGACHVSCQVPTYALEIARAGAKREVVWKKEDLPGKAYPVPQRASARGCGWPAAFTLPVGAGWKSGYYAGRLT